MLDDSDVMGEQPYTLEVDVARRRPAAHPPAPLAAQPRPAGRGHASPTGARLAGRIAASDDAPATLHVDGEEQQVRLPTSSKARIQIEFNRKDC